MKFRNATFVVLSIILISCGGDSPTAPGTAFPPQFFLSEARPLPGTVLAPGIRLTVEGSFSLPAAFAPACVALVGVRGDGLSNDSVVVGAAYAEPYSEPSGNRIQRIYQLDETFWGSIARGAVVNGLFLVGKKGDVASCGNHLFTSCVTNSNSFRTCIRSDNVVIVQLIPLQYRWIQ